MSWEAIFPNKDAKEKFIFNLFRWYACVWACAFMFMYMRETEMSLTHVLYYKPTGM